jgi:hypothetical protein
LYHNTSEVTLTNSTVASTDVPDDDIQILAQSNTLGYSSKQHALAFAGAGLDQSEVTAFTNAVETYMDSNGKGVIS